MLYALAYRGLIWLRLVRLRRTRIGVPGISFLRNNSEYFATCIMERNLFTHFQGGIIMLKQIIIKIKVWKIRRKINRLWITCDCHELYRDTQINRLLDEIEKLES